MGSFRPARPPVRLSKLRGQHFLADKNVAAKIVAAAELASGDTVLEIGPGLGVMTRGILPRVARLVAVELDPFFVHELRKEFGGDHRIEIIEGDILKMRIFDLLNSYAPQAAGYKLITNLPYNITSAFLKKFLIEPPAPERIVVMLQKEVAERILAVRTNNKELNSKIPANLLGLMCNLYAECSPVCSVPPGAFAPPPKVDSAVILLKPYSPEAFAAKWGIDRGFAEDIIGMAAKFFAEPRKKMCGAFGKELREKCRTALSEIGENPDSRPAVIGIGKWVELWKEMR